MTEEEKEAVVKSVEKICLNLEGIYLSRIKFYKDYCYIFFGVIVLQWLITVYIVTGGAPCLK